MVDRVLALEEGTRLYILAPMIRGRKGEYKKELAELMKKGFQRVKVDGQFYEIAEVPALDKKYKHDIDVVVDRLVVRGEETLRRGWRTAWRPAFGWRMGWPWRSSRTSPCRERDLGRRLCQQVAERDA